MRASKLDVLLRELLTYTKIQKCQNNFNCNQLSPSPCPDNQFLVFIWARAYFIFLCPWFELTQSNDLGHCSKGPEEKIYYKDIIYYIINTLIGSIARRRCAFVLHYGSLMCTLLLGLIIGIYSRAHSNRSSRYLRKKEYVFKLLTDSRRFASIPCIACTNNFA